MKRKLHSFIIAASLVAGFGGLLGATVPTATADAACGRFLTFPAWYEGLTRGSNCELRAVGDSGNKVSLETYIWTIVLNVIEIILQVIGYVAIFMVLYGGFLYMTSDGNQQRMASGLKTIINATIGIVIALSAIAIKNFAWQVLTGGGRVNSFGVYQADPSAILAAGLNAAYFIAGAIAVTVIIISGIRYITSAGSPDGVSKAKRSLIGGVIGLVIVIAAAAITQFILEWFR